MLIQQIDNGRKKRIKEKFDIKGPYPIDITKDLSIDIFHNKKVWSPFSAPRYLQQIYEQDLHKEFAGARVLDVGSGSGILGIAAAKWGAEHVTMIDNNPEAVRMSMINAKQNGIDANRITLLESNVFDALSKGKKFDVIIGNLPMNPALPGVHARNPAFESNSNGTFGRDVLDRVILDANKFLSENGLLIVSASSRQNLPRTVKGLNENFGSGNYGVLNATAESPFIIGEPEKLVEEYHGPFVMTWITLSLLQYIPLIYKLDKNANPYISWTDDNKIIELGYAPDPVTGSYILVYIYRNGEGPKVYEVENADLAGIRDDIDPTILSSQQNLDSPYYHTNALIAVRNSQREES